MFPVFLHERRFLRMGQALDGDLAAQGVGLVGAALEIDQLDRAVGAGVFGAAAALVRGEAGGDVVRPAAVQRAARAGLRSRTAFAAEPGLHHRDRDPAVPDGPQAFPAKPR